MRRRLARAGEEYLPRCRLDALRQLLMFVVAYAGYEIVRGLVGLTGDKPFRDATRIIDFERTLHVFVEPNVQRWVMRNAHWLLDICDWTYLNAHFALTVGALAFIYMRRNDSFYFVRNMFMIAMLIALVGYSVFPTTPPWLMPRWGFTDSIRQFTGVAIGHGASGALLNVYAAVPSMHVCFALIVGLPMSRLMRHRIVRVLWLLYPAFITFVVIATGNHYFTDVALGALTAGLSVFLAKQLLARARPDVWAFAGVAA